MHTKRSIKLYLFLIICLSFIALFMFFFKTPKNTKTEKSNIYTLKSYRNCVALYENQEIVEIYNEIVLNNLPPTDRQILEKGINFNSKTDVQSALEDYDS